MEPRDFVLAEKLARVKFYFKPYTLTQSDTHTCVRTHAHTHTDPGCWFHSMLCPRVAAMSTQAHAAPPQAPRPCGWLTTQRADPKEGFHRESEDLSVSLGRVSGLLPLLLAALLQCSPTSIQAPGSQVNQTEPRNHADRVVSPLSETVGLPGCPLQGRPQEFRVRDRGILRC